MILLQVVTWFIHLNAKYLIWDTFQIDHFMIVIKVDSEATMDTALCNKASNMQCRKLQRLSRVGYRNYSRGFASIVAHRLFSIDIKSKR